MALPVDRKDLTTAVEAQAAGDDPLDRLVAALAVQAELDALGADLVQRFVDRAREAGCSWSKIGVALGVSKQAVQQRFSPRATRTATLPEPGPPGLAALLAAAGHRAQACGRAEVEPVDLAAALLPGEGGSPSLASAVLDRLGVHPGAVAPPAGGQRPDERRRGGTSRSAAATAVLRRASEVAAGRGAGEADSGDVLQAVVEEVDLPGAGAAWEPSVVADEVARLRRWGFADGGTPS